MWIAGKLAGCLCILAASWLIGCELERGLLQRRQFLREMQELFVYLEKEMTYHRTPVAEALQEASRSCGSKLQELLSVAAGGAEEYAGVSFQKIWEDAVRQCLPAGFLTPEEYAAVCGAGQALCSTDTVMQRTWLERYAARFEELAKRAAAVCAEKGRLYRRLAAAAGIFLVIVLL